MHKRDSKILSLIFGFILIFQQSGFAQLTAEFDIAGHIANFHNSFVIDKFRPIHLRYLQYDPLNNNFRLFLDKGDQLKQPSETNKLDEQAKELLKYFYIGLTLPNSKFWVNLRPDAEYNIIDDYLAKTDIGRIMLETDLQLKKDTAAMTSPKTPEGRQYWDKLYKKAVELYGYDNVTIPTLTRPWIVPGEIIIRETKDSAYIYKATLKVMLEQDYLATNESAIANSADYSFKDERAKTLNEYSTQLIRELIIPKLTKEVNSSKRYAGLRQVYYSLIMAQWFKARFKGPSSEGAVSKLIDSQNLTNLISQEAWSKTTYFQAYQKSFKDGEYNIQEPVYTPTGQVIRSYFSGGEQLGLTAIPLGDINGLVASIRVSASPTVIEPQDDSYYLIETEVPITNNPGEGGTIGRWSYTHTSLDRDGNLMLHNATRIPGKDGVLEEEFLIDGENKPRDIVLKTRRMNKTEITKAAGIEKELGMTMPPRIIIRDVSAIKHRIYGLASHGIPFIREDIIDEGSRDQIKEAFDHENRELTEASHDDIRRSQYQGYLRELIRSLSNKDKGTDLSRVGAAFSGELRTFEEYITTSLGRGVEEIQEIELFAMWALYLSELDRTFVDASDFRQAYSLFYDIHTKYLTKAKIKPKAVKPYVPIVRRPFSSVEEIKNIVDVDTEWSIDFLPQPDNWKGPSLYSFILSVVGGQLHMSFYDSNGLIREFNKDEETETALRTIGLIGNEGLVVLVRSSFIEQLKGHAVPGIGGRISLTGHSHPKESGVAPSESRSLGNPADVELFALRLAGLPERYPINRDIPKLAARKQKALDEGKNEKGGRTERARQLPDRPADNLRNMLGAAIERLKSFAGSQAGKESLLPINELVLYLKVLRAMYDETIGTYKGSGADHEYVHSYRAEFAGELAHHPRFQGEARRMLQESLEGAFRVLGEQISPRFLDEPGSLLRMMSVVSQLIEESSSHPEFRERAIELINDPRTYGLGDIVLAKAAAIAVRTQEFAAVSDQLFKEAKKGKGELRDELKPRPEDVVRARASRLLVLSDRSVNDEPEIAEAALREYLRLVKTFGDKIDFYVAVTLDRHENIMNSQPLRPTLIETVRSVPDTEDRNNMLTRIAVQLTGEGDIQGSLDLLEEIGSATFYVFSDALEQLADLLLVPGERNEKMIQQLERIIENVPIATSRGRYDERKIGLFVKLGDKYAELGMRGNANSNYRKAWELSAKAEQPAVTRLEYFVPLMREKGLEFPVSRTDIINEARRIGESEITRNRLLGKPDTLIAIAREHAFNRDYEKAEEVAQFINDNMDYPRDHYDHCYGAIIEAAALHGNNERIGQAVSKMTHYVKDHFERAAQLLVNRGEYVKAMELANFAMEQGYMGSSTVGYWGSTQVRIARDVLKKDSTQIEMVREALGKAISRGGIGDHDLEQVIDMIAEHPELDPDGQFTLQILQSGFERNQSIIAHHGHRVILRKLREIIMARVKDVDPSLRRITDVYRRVNGALPAPEEDTAAVPNNSKVGSSPLTGASYFQEQSKDNGVGGIDFRALPIVTQAMTNLKLSSSSAMSIGKVQNINLNQELEDLQKMVKAGIVPSTDRIKEYVDSSCLKGELDIQKIISCIANILRLEEEHCIQTDSMLRDILVVLESSESVENLRAVFSRPIPQQIPLQTP